MNNPIVTVLMPVYNGEKHLDEAIVSILNQTFTDFEFLIVNDGSTDTSEEKILSYKDDRIRYIKNDNNIGLISTLNKGIRLARGKYIARMDADDISFSDRLEKQVLFLDTNPLVELVFSKLLQINASGEEAGVWKEDMQAVSMQQIKDLLPQINCLGHPTVMMRKQIVERYGYNKNYIHSEDWGLWLTLLSNGYTMAKLDEVLLKYRIHTGGVTFRVNQESVGRKIVRFKYFYLKDKISKGNFRTTDFKVLNFFIRDFLKYNSPSFLLMFFRGIRKKPWKIAMEFIAVSSKLRSKKQINHLFFFPFYHTGGAEQVHGSILESVSDKEAIVFITGQSGNKALLNEFKRNAEVIDIHHLVEFSLTKKWLIRRMARIASENDKLIMFGCNSKFYYEIIPSISDNIRCIDLIHAFVHSYEDGPEKWSLDVVSRLSNRVVITGKTKIDLERLYTVNSIPASLLTRVICIPNFTQAVPVISKKSEEVLRILYVGRGGEEKRIYLISKAASILSGKKLPVEFHFAGDVKKAIPENELQYCILHGEITDQKQLQDMYASSHILLVSSSREGFPMVIMEAMMNGVVPISTNVGGISEHVINQQNGILIENTNSEEIIKAFTSSIEYFYNHRDVLNELSVNAHNYALINFKKEAFVQSYKKLLAN